jgi:Tol biopolymer transport system component
VPNEDIQNLLRTAIQAAQGGNKPIARRILQQIVSQDPQNEMAWIWMASVTEALEERQNCLQKVLEINPNNERAKQALEKLKQMPSTPGPQREVTAVQPLRHTPPMGQPAVSSPPRLEREALLRTAPHRRQRFTPPLVLAGLLAVGMIVVGGGMLVNFLLKGENKNNQTPTPQIPGVEVVPSTQEQEVSFVTPTPLGGTLVTFIPMENMPATWTPTATWTPLPSSTPTPTPLPLTEYTLLVSGMRDDQTEWALYTMLADGTRERRLALTLEDSNLTLVEAYDAAFSPDGRQVVFTAVVSQSIEQEGQTVTEQFEDLFIAPSGGGPAHRLTRVEASHVEGAAWSPDGNRIAYTSNQDGDYDIYVINLDGYAVMPLTSNTVEDRDPTWSPDGEWIAFASDLSGPGFLEVWRMQSDGSGAEQLTDDSNSSYAPAWSPDGRYIAFVSDRRVDTDLYVMNADGTGETLLTINDDSYEERDPAWSPDSKWIAFSSNRASDFFEIYIIYPDGSGLQRITVDEGDNRYVAWKPFQ